MARIEPPRWLRGLSPAHQDLVIGIAFVFLFIIGMAGLLMTLFDVRVAEYETQTIPIETPKQGNNT